jgi:hypothetical protein
MVPGSMDAVNGTTACWPIGFTFSPAVSVLDLAPIVFRYVNFQPAVTHVGPGDDPLPGLLARFRRVVCMVGRV